MTDLEYVKLALDGLVEVKKVSDRLRVAVGKHNIQKDGEFLDVLVCNHLDDVTAERDRLKANLDEVQDAARRLERRMTALLDFLAELGLNDPLSSASFVAQVREKLAARDAAQQRAGAVKVLRRLTQDYARPGLGEIVKRADAIERGEVAL